MEDSPYSQYESVICPRLFPLDADAKAITWGITHAIEHVHVAAPHVDECIT